YQRVLRGADIDQALMLAHNGADLRLTDAAGNTLADLIIKKGIESHSYAQAAEQMISCLNLVLINKSTIVSIELAIKLYEHLLSVGEIDQALKLAHKLGDLSLTDSQRHSLGDSLIMHAIENELCVFDLAQIISALDLEHGSENVSTEHVHKFYEYLLGQGYVTPAMDLAKKGIDLSVTDDLGNTLADLLIIHAVANKLSSDALVKIIAYLDLENVRENISTSQFDKLYVYLLCANGLNQALTLAREGADLSLTDAQGQTLGDLLITQTIERKLAPTMVDKVITYLDMENGSKNVSIEQVYKLFRLFLCANDLDQALKFAYKLGDFSLTDSQRQTLGDLLVTHALENKLPSDALVKIIAYLDMENGSKNVSIEQVHRLYKHLLHVGFVDQAIELAQKGADLGVPDDQGNTLGELVFKKACASKLSDSSITQIKGYLGLQTGMQFISFERVQAFFQTCYAEKNYDLCAFLLIAMLEEETQNFLLDKLSLKAAQADDSFTPLQVGALSPYIENLSQNIASGSCQNLETRYKEQNDLALIFCKETKKVPLIYGQKGIGKSSVIASLARDILEKDAPDFLHDKQVLTLDVRKLLKAVDKGEISLHHVNTVFSELKGKAVIFFDHLELIEREKISSSRYNASFDDLLDLISKHSELHFVGACSTERFALLEKSDYFQSLITPFHLKEVGKEEAFQMIKRSAEKIAKEHHVSIDDEALHDLLSLSKRYVSNAHYPYTPIQTLLETALRLSKQQEFGSLKIQELKTKITKLRIEKKYLETAPGEFNEEKINKMSTELEESEKKIEQLTKDQILEKALQYRKRNHQERILKLKQLSEKVSDLEAREKINQLIASYEERISLVDQELQKQVSGYQKHVIDRKMIKEVISELTGIPISKIADNEKDKLKGLENALKERVKGQDHAISAVAGSVRRARFGLNGENRPRGVFLFLGPTGVGKTELAKTLAEELMGSESKLIRIDMSEYHSGYDKSRLIGTSPGYVGYEDKGVLTEALKKNPYSVVLLDEIEKGSPLILDLFLQVFDDGRLTDGHGETVSCKEAIFIMTSNAGTWKHPFNKDDTTPAPIKKPAPTKTDDDEDDDDDLNEVLKDNFRPEFINRIDDIIQFNSLDNPAIVRKIADHQLEELKKKVLRQLKVTISYTEEVVQDLVTKGISPEFGARPLKRLVEKELMSLISDAILNEELSEGGAATFILKEGKITLSIMQNEE
ncbi:MAG: ATP-dependent Clp protease ATP-binding subunit, partial [Chlamydiia bacterium]|nr:ATP-dependent Clp protease ATP-binding subunit [Chlamydiia bacterium]